MPRVTTYKALIGDRDFDIVIKDDVILVNGKAADVQFHATSGTSYVLILDGESHDIFVEETSPNHYTLTSRGRPHKVQVKDERDLLLEKYGLASTDQQIEKEVRAPMPGLVLDIKVAEGQVTNSGDSLLVLEAMKMENEIRASTGGTVSRIHVKPGDAVSKNDLLIEF